MAEDFASGEAAVHLGARRKCFQILKQARPRLVQAVCAAFLVEAPDEAWTPIGGARPTAEDREGRRVSPDLLWEAPVALGECR